MAKNIEIQNLIEAIKISPDNVPLKSMLLHKYMELHRLDEAYLEAQSILKLDPQHSSTKEHLVKIYFGKEKYSTAIIVAEELKEQNLANTASLLLLAKSYYKEGSINQANDLYQSLIKLNPLLADEELDGAFRQVIDFEDLEDELNPSLMEKPSLSFKDVGGMETVKKEIDLKIIKPLKNADLFAKYGKKVGGGILLYGPPGCGKTFLSKATAGEIDAHFISVGINEILDMWIGNSEKNLHDIFETARSLRPCVLFFDEIDALGANRTDLKKSGGRNIINQFLAELDGISSDNDGILIIGATNAPWHLDPAFRRPGRFDRIIFVPPPDIDSKVKIMELMTKDRPIEHIDFKKIAEKTKDYSGADLFAIIDIAVEELLMQALETGEAKPISTKSLLSAIKKHKASTIDWFNSAKNYALYANQSGLYDDILKYMDRKR